MAKAELLRRILIWFTCVFAVVFVPIETYICWSLPHIAVQLSGYIVNVFGVGITLWA